MMTMTKRDWGEFLGTALMCIVVCLVALGFGFTALLITDTVSNTGVFSPHGPTGSSSTVRTGLLLDV
jgi:hypothetical protein